MNIDFIIVDVQGFKDFNNQFIVKELALSTKEYTQTFLIKPPYAFHSLTDKEKKHVKWVEKNLGIFWSEGFIDYKEFKRIIVKYLQGRKILTKGMEKVKWINELCTDCKVIDLGQKGCLNMNKLHINYCDNIVELNCNYHSKCCALKNVLCIKKWYGDNNMYKFNLFH